MKALVLCHNVSPVKEEEEEEAWSGNGARHLEHDMSEEEGNERETVLFEKEDIIFQRQGETGQVMSYQASSPDEVSYIPFVYFLLLISPLNLLCILVL